MTAALGPGRWRLDTSNFPRPLTAAARELLGPAIDAGFGRGCARYGVGVETLRVGFHAGRAYMATIPLALEMASGRVPIAEETLRSRRWHADARRWRDEQRPALVERLRALENVPLAGATDAELARHLRDVASQVVDAFALHMELHLVDMLPTGRLLVATRAHGLPDARVAAALAGASPASSAMDAEAHGSWRAVGGWDIDRPTLAELPPLAPTRRAGGGADGRAALRGDIPPSDWPLIEDAWATFGLRDDNAGLTMQWPIGLLRRAYLELARRRPGVEVLEATVDEAVSLCHGSAAPSSARLHRRAIERHRNATAVAPTVVGDHVRRAGQGSYPGAVGVLTDALAAYFDLLGTQPAACAMGGLGVGVRRVRGVARVAVTPDDAIGVLGPGDVLVVVSTTPAFDPVIAMAGALVTEAGGLLSHAAVVARELGIPAVLGVAAATTLIPDGALVDVDPASGEVRIVGS